MKKILLILFFPFCAAAGGQKHFFTITGYYSPLPTQKFFLTGNYESEIRLNGRGIAGSDETPVYPGMIAAPANFLFGTKIKIPGFGVGAVHDRGGAIVKKGARKLAQHDRLDLWMGRGEVGLRRALAFGVQHLECEIFPADSKISENVNFDVPPALHDLIGNLPGQIFSRDLQLGDRGDEILELQKILKKLGFFTENFSKNFDEKTKMAVFNFQKKFFIVEKISDTGAGRVGPKTRAKLAAENRRAEIQKRIFEMWQEFHFAENLERGARGDAVFRLQEILVAAEFLAIPPTGFFGPQTEFALKNFQISHQIIANEKSAGAGRVGPKTKKKLNEILAAKKNFLKNEKKKFRKFSQQQQKFFALKNKISANFAAK